MGQFCTVGSSPAADHCLRGAGIEAMHFRIGCRLNGSFLECLGDQSTVIINGIPRNRARLSNGDRIKIGIVELEVDMPQKERKQSFSVSFDDEDESPEGMSSIVGQSMEIEFDDHPEEVIAASRQTPVFAAAEDIFADGEFMETESGSSIPAILNTTDDQKTEEDLIPEPAIASEKKEPEGEPIFKFDSADLNDSPFSLEDLSSDALSGEPISPEHESPHLDHVETQDRTEAASEDTDSGEKNGLESQTQEDRADQAQTDHNSEQQSQLPLGDEIIAGGSSQSGKCWKWVGSDAIDALERIQNDLNPTCYMVNDSVALVEDSVESIHESIARMENRIFLITTKCPDEIMEFVVAKRWTDRMRHPGGLSILPVMRSTQVKSLLQQVENIVLVQDGSLSVIRLTNRLGIDSRERESTQG